MSCYRHGAAVVSTMPTTFNGSLQPSARVHIGGLTRQTLDMDDFSSGFGTWSGTSFAAPILAGELPAALLDAGSLDLCHADAAVDRGWQALHTVAQMDRP